MTISTLKTPSSPYAHPPMDDPNDAVEPSRVHEASNLFRGSEGHSAPPSGNRVVRPTDWPGPGPIDLKVHDLPHASSTTEWWYANSHVQVQDGRRFSVWVAFFRQLRGQNPKTLAYEYVHSVTWGISCLDEQKYIFYSGVDPCAPSEGLKRVRRGLGAKDEKLNRALCEILERGNVPGPDRLLPGRVFVALDRLELEYGDATFKKLDDGSYQLNLSDGTSSCALSFRPKKPATRHGDDGLVKGSDNEDMFYYFIPRCEVTGKLNVGGRELAIAEASGWYDHEFGVGDIQQILEDDRDAPMTDEMKVARRKKKEHDTVAWNWLSCQLDNGTDISVYPEQYIERNKSAGEWAIVIDRDGNRSMHTDITLEPIDFWQSNQTFFEYPIAWRVSVPSAGIQFTVRAAFEDQEFITLITRASFWEGRVEVEGTLRGKPVRGPGFVERSGYGLVEDLDDYFENVGKVVRGAVARAIPLKLDHETAAGIVGSNLRPHYLDGLDLDQLARTFIAPIREITDRGGKGWRSYALITCCDVVGGDSRTLVDWLAMPELMHVGSLIVDDVEDKSVVRRGKPTAHMIYGEAQAINSGTAAYFIMQKLLAKTTFLSAADRLRVYDLYFEGMRAGHAGQAIDLDGFDAEMPAYVESGAGHELERRVMAVHRLKTAAPAGTLARMGSIAGGGSDAQVEGMGQFFEALGMAFQIVDDVLNLRGFKGDLKSKGEDIVQGKITLPVAKAISRLDLAERRWLYATLRSKPEDPKVVAQVIDKLEACGAIEDCKVQADKMIDDAWHELAPLVEDTLAKMMLRAFGWFVLERHY
ncbi:MAG TPA: polyprenyl synthetase family protein [Polyangiaceae bacterium]|nr:polyprenyl synthetase family protein [Polyangiaceae bacterium]